MSTSDCPSSVAEGAPRRGAWGTSATLLALGLLVACGATEEASRLHLEVVTDESGLEAVTTDLGYEIDWSEARMVVEDFRFRTAGEAHTRAPARRLGDLLLPAALAHPGHVQGGEVIGELPGRFVLRWLPEAASVGSAILLAGTYTSADFTFATGTETDGIGGDDPLLGHTALLRGVAVRGGKSIPFLVLVDAPPGRQLLGIPFPFEATKNSNERIHLRLLARAPHGGATLLDGVDFGALRGEDDPLLLLDASRTGPLLDAYLRVQRRLLTHDHFEIRPS